MTRCGKWKAGISIGLVVFTPSVQASVGRAGVDYALGISRVGTSDSQSIPAFEKLEKRVERWLESEPEWNLRGKGLGALDRALAGFDARVGRLDRLLGEVWVNPAALGELNATVESLSAVRELAPRIQQARVAQAFLAWKSGDERAFHGRLGEAQTLHPEGKLSDASVGLLPASERSSFLSAAAKQPAPTRGCAVDLEVTPAEANVWLDGFSLGGRRRFELLRGKAYQAWVRADGFAPKEVALDCRRAGQWIESVRLERGRDRDDRTLARLRYLSEVSGVGSVVFAEKLGGERVGLFLYTPGAGVDTVPTEKPLTLASLQETGADERLPVATDAFTDLVARHRAQPFKVGMQQTGESGYDVASLRVEPQGRAWYRKPAFWVVVGAVGAGIATALLLGRSQRGVQSSPGITAKVE